MKTKINFTRICLFINRYLKINFKTIGVNFLVGGCFIFLITLLKSYNLKYIDISGFSELGLFIIFIIGLYITSKIFKESLITQTAYNYLTLPVSSLERLVGTWFITSPLFIFIMFVFLIIILLLCYLVLSMFHLSPDINLNIFTASFLDGLKAYIIIQPVFLLGAISLTEGTLSPAFHSFLRMLSLI